MATETVTRDIKDTVNMMDALSQQGFGNIAAIAKLGATR